MFKQHPTVTLVSAIGCLLAAVGLFFFRGQMASEGIGGDDAYAYLIGYAFDFIEVGMIAFIVSPVAPRVQQTLAYWGVGAPRKKIERVIDSICFLALLFVYGFDFYATAIGCLARGFDTEIAWTLAGLQLVMFELLANIGFWLIEDWKQSHKAMKEQAIGYGEEMEGLEDFFENNPSVRPL